MKSDPTFACSPASRIADVASRPGSSEVKSSFGQIAVGPRRSPGFGGSPFGAPSRRGWSFVRRLALDSIGELLQVCGMVWTLPICARRGSAKMPGSDLAARVRRQYRKTRNSPPQSWGKSGGKIGHGDEKQRLALKKVPRQFMRRRKSLSCRDN